MIQNIQSLFNIQTKTIGPSTATITYVPSDGYNAMSSITVNKVTSSIDNNIKAANIKQGIIILGVTGSFQADTCVSCNTCQNCVSWQQCVSCQASCDTCMFCVYCQYCNYCELRDGQGCCEDCEGDS